MQKLVTSLLANSGRRVAMNRTALSAAFVLASLAAVPGLSGTAAAENQAADYTPIGPNMAIEESEVALSIPEDNSLPWAFVEGTVSNPVPDYPVIIQIYDNDGSAEGNSAGAVHFAQSPVGSDGSYEYKFRVLDRSQGLQTNVFEGEYTVKIFKVVYLDGLGAV